MDPDKYPSHSMWIQQHLAVDSDMYIASITCSSCPSYPLPCAAHIPHKQLQDLTFETRESFEKFVGDLAANHGCMLKVRSSHKDRDVLFCCVNSFDTTMPFKSHRKSSLGTRASQQLLPCPFAISGHKKIDVWRVQVRNCMHSCQARSVSGLNSIRSNLSASSKVILPNQSEFKADSISATLNTSVQCQSTNDKRDISVEHNNSKVLSDSVDHGFTAATNTAVLPLASTGTQSFPRLSLLSPGLWPLHHTTETHNLVKEHANPILVEHALHTDLATNSFPNVSSDVFSESDALAQFFRQIGPTLAYLVAAQQFQSENPGNLEHLTEQVNSVLESQPLLKSQYSFQLLMDQLSQHIPLSPPVSQISSTMMTQSTSCNDISVKRRPLAPRPGPIFERCIPNATVSSTLPLSHNLLRNAHVKKPADLFKYKRQRAKCKLCCSADCPGSTKGVFGCRHKKVNTKRAIAPAPPVIMENQMISETISLTRIETGKISGTNSEIRFRRTQNRNALREQTADLI